MRSDPRLLTVALLAAASAGGVWLWSNRSDDSEPPAAASGARAPSEPAPASLPILPGGSTKPRDPELAEKYDKRDAERDEGWDTEVFNERAGAQLSALGKLLGHAAELAPAELEALADEEFACGPLRPRELSPAWRDEAVSVARAGATAAAPVFRGRAGLAEALRELAAPHGHAGSVEAKFKVIEVTPGPDSVATTAYFLASSFPPSGAVQQNATWRLRWKQPSAGGGPPRLLSIEVAAFEEVVGPRGGATLFRDCTESVLGANPSWKEQLARSLDHWAAVLDPGLGVSILGHEGLAVGDVNADGLDDLFVCQPGGLPDRLFVQQEDSSAIDVSAEAGLDWLDVTRSALILDLDGDRDQDLAVCTDPTLLVLANDGQGRFLLAGAIEASSVASLAAADYDLDGDLDLYLCGYEVPESEEKTPIPYHDANNGRPNRLLRNEGGLRFVEVTSEVGLDQNNRRFSFAAAWEDFDNDGDPDLYVANDFGRNNLYRNDSGSFTDVAAAAGVEDVAASMGVSWADFDGDGWMDLYVSNMFSSAGERVTHQRNFRPDLDPATRALYQRHARGNSLFRNRGDGSFEDVSIESGTTMGRWAWGAMFLDANNDSRPDLFVPNGFVTGEDPVDL